MTQPTLEQMIEQIAQHQVSGLAEEREAQRQPLCPCCGSNKRPGHLVCERCYKTETPTGLVPLKFSGMTYSTWIRQARSEQNERGLHVLEGGAS